MTDADGRCLYTNAAVRSLCGFSGTEAFLPHLRDLFHPADYALLLKVTSPASQGVDGSAVEARILRADGSNFWARVHTCKLGEDHRSGERLLVIEDISARKLREASLILSQAHLTAEKERAQVTLDSIGDAVLATDRSEIITFLNPVAERMTGWSLQRALGQPLTAVLTIVDGESRQRISNPAKCAMEENRTVALVANSILVRRDGHEYFVEDSAAPIHDRDGHVTGAVMVFHDVSQSRAISLRMAHLAQHDLLTDLPNRALLTERLQQAIGLAHRNDRRLAVLYLDVDHFKHVNDSLGHLIGDDLLISIAGRLKSCVRVTDTVCRQGGDEFVILLSEVDDIQDAELVAQKIGTAFQITHPVSGHHLHVTLSIGISVYPDDGITAENILRNADIAMYQVKATGRDGHKFFESEMSVRAMHRLRIEGSLRRALRQGEFLLLYQPKIDLQSGLITGSEALIRWSDPMLGILYPSQFIQIAEQSGLIVSIGRWVVMEACRQTRAWLDSGLNALPVSVNISALEFRHPAFTLEIRKILDETALPAGYLELELTESILMREGEPNVAVLAELKALGVRLAIDDFGTGYSSLSYLKRLPVDTLKLDQSLIRDIVTNPDSIHVVGAVIDLGRKLHQRVVAEGVETSTQVDLLRARHCDEGQGYHFSHPLSSEAMAALLTATPTHSLTGVWAAQAEMIGPPPPLLSDNSAP